MKPLSEIYKPPPGKQMISSVSIDDQMDLRARMLGISTSKVDENSLSNRKNFKINALTSEIKPYTLFSNQFG